MELTDMFNAREQALLAEALMIESYVPCKRQFTHQELEPYLLRIRQAARDVAGIAEERT